MSFLAEILSWLKEAPFFKPRVLFALWFSTGIILLLDQIVVITVPINFRWIVCLVTLFTFVLWLVQICPTIKDWKYERAERNDLLNSIFYLPLEQKAVLAIALYRNNPIISKPISDSLIKPLWNRGMIDAMGEFDECYDNGPCKIEGFVWRYVGKNKDKILTEDIKKQLQKDE